MRRAASLAVWFALLEGLWLVFVGTRATTEIVAGLAAAAVGTAFAEALRSQGLLAFSVEPRLIARLPRFALELVTDFLVLTRVLTTSLARGRRVRGAWVTVPFETGDGAAGRGQRAFAALAGTATPNAIVVDLDRGEALLHALDPDVPSGHQVLP